MFSSASRLTFSKLKVFSGLLDCSVSSLRSFSKVSNSRHPHFPIYTSTFTSKLRFFSSDESPFNSVNLDAITGGNEDLIKKLKVIILEAEVLRQEGMRVPAVMTDERWLELLNAPSKSQRLKLLSFWWLNEKRKENSKQKKEVARQKREEFYNSPENKVETDHITYGFGGSTLFLRIYDTAIDHFHNCKLIHSMKFGQDLVLDCSYDKHMNPQESSLCASQLKEVFAENRLQNEPFNLHFCNANKEGYLFKKLLKYIPTMYAEHFPMNITEKSYLDLFPKEKLVYLTPHCREELKDFSHDDIYIIGAMVDKVNNDPLSLAKAKSEGLRMARLPLERYLDWGVGTKSLTLNQVLLILHELKTSGDWRKALKYVPKRKIKGEDFDKKHGSSYRRKPLNVESLLSNS